MMRELSGEFSEREEWQQREKVEKLEELGVRISQDAYDAVIVAAFGGVTINLKNTETIQVHPFYLFLLVLPLFSIQLSLIMFIDLAFSPLEPVRDKATTTELVFKTKLLIVFVLQLTLFKEMLQAVRLFIFMLNPFTWMTIVRTNHKDDSFMYEPLVLAPFPILASFMKIVVCYMTMSSSVSIILTSRDATDAIFDGLAITFIADLDETFWAVYAYLFHIEEFEGFVFEKVNARSHSRKHGISPHDVGTALTSLTMFLLYVRQMCVVKFAVITNVLPIARDLCTFRRWLRGESQFFGAAAAVFRFCTHQFLVLDPSELILTKGEDELGEGEDFCNLTETDPNFVQVATEPKYERMMWSNMLQVYETYPGSSYGITIALFFVIVFPQLIHVGFRMLYRTSISESGYSSLRKLHSVPLEGMNNEWDHKPMDKLEQDLAILKILRKGLNETELKQSIELCSKAIRRRRAESGPLSAAGTWISENLVPESFVPKCCSEQSISFANVERERV